MGNIFIWFTEYWHIIAVCVVIVYLLINDYTRKITFKVLCGIFLFVFGAAVVFLVCIWIFGVDNGLAAGCLVFFNFMFSVMIYMSAGELCRVVRLNRKGIHIYGTLISRAGGRGVSRVAYSADGKKYECKSSSQLNRYKIGHDKVPVVYDAENHGNSCVEKDDFVQSTALFITSVIFETGMIIITVCFFFYIFP